MLKSPQNTSEIWQLRHQPCQSFWISLSLLVSSALDSWTACPINMSLRLHHQPFWSNCHWIKFRSFSTCFQNKIWLPAIAILCLVIVMLQGLQKRNTLCHLRHQQGYIWIQFLGAFEVLEILFTKVFHTFLCRSICHRICIEAMDVWTPEICVHLAVKAIDDIALKTNSCWKSLVWIYLPQFSWQTSFCHTLVSSLDPTDVSNFCAWPRQQPFQAPGFRRGFSIMWM